MHLSHIPLEGRHIRLEPYGSANRDEVRRALDVDPEGWSLFVRTGMGEHFDRWWSNAMENQQAGLFANYAIRRLADGRVVGSTSFLDIAPGHRRVEVGATFLHPDVRSGVVNPESKRLLLGHAFDCGACGDHHRRPQSAQPGGDRQAGRRPRGGAAQAQADLDRLHARHRGLFGDRR